MAAAPIPNKGPADIAKKSVLLIPAIVLIVIFFIIPIVLTVYYSFTNLALTGSNASNTQVVGFENYSRMISDPNLWVSIRNTLIFLLGSLAGQQLIGFIIAYAMKSRNKYFRRVTGTCVLAAWVMPEMVVSLCMLAFFREDGTLNLILQQSIPWLYTAPMFAVILANVWRGTAFSMMVYQSALDGVSGDIEEAAAIDGANKFQQLIRIVIPCIKDTIATNTMLNTLQTLGVFGLIYAMTGGGPSNATLTLPIFMYKQAFVGFQFGYGTAISMVLLFLGILLSVLYTRLAGND